MIEFMSTECSSVHRYLTQASRPRSSLSKQNKKQQAFYLKKERKLHLFKLQNSITFPCPRAMMFCGRLNTDALLRKGLCQCDFAQTPCSHHRAAFLMGFCQESTDHFTKTEQFLQTACQGNIQVWKCQVQLQKGKLENKIGSARFSKLHKPMNTQRLKCHFP